MQALLSMPPDIHRHHHYPNSLMVRWVKWHERRATEHSGRSISNEVECVSALQIRSEQANLEGAVQQAQGAVQAEAQRRQAAEARVASLEQELASLRTSTVSPLSS